LRSIFSIAPRRNQKDILLIWAKPSALSSFAIEKAFFEFDAGTEIPILGARVIMITDPIPRTIAKRAEYDRSDRIGTLALPNENRLQEQAFEIESAMSLDMKHKVQTACSGFLAEAARCFNVPQPAVRVLDARPLRVYESGLSELFGDYQLNTAMIRVWMRTAVKKRVTSFGTLLNTICHEFCHHLDVLQLGFPNSFHTRGFYQRTALLYHHCRGTPFRPLVWHRFPNGRWRIDWVQMRRPRVRID
jgi:hypothetical protein